MQRTEQSEQRVPNAFHLSTAEIEAWQAEGKTSLRPSLQERLEARRQRQAERADAQPGR